MSSFIANLKDKQRKPQGVVTPQAEAVPISIAELVGGLSGNFRDPYRVSGPLNSVTAPATRDSIPLPTHDTQQYI